MHKLGVVWMPFGSCTAMHWGGVRSLYFILIKIFDSCSYTLRVRD